MHHAVCGLRHVRGLRHKAPRFPSVKASEVVLEKPRYGFRRLRPDLLHQLVKSLLPKLEIEARYKAAGKPVPIRFLAKGDDIARRNYNNFKAAVQLGEPHFRVGEKPVYFPNAVVRLLRPNAKHTPYQAKFLVPRNFNKMDLRDYLWHVYGLRALNVTVQLLHAPYTRTNNDYGRYRGAQYKKMTIDMEEPFIWPPLPAGFEAEAKRDKEDIVEFTINLDLKGSDRLKPRDEFDGVFSKVDLPNVFVLKRRQKVVAEQPLGEKEDREMVGRFLKL